MRDGGSPGAGGVARGVATPRGWSVPRDRPLAAAPGHGLPGVQPPPLTPVPSPGRVWLRSLLRAAFPDLPARSPPLPCVRPLSLTLRMPCEMIPCSPGEWGSIRAALHARSPADECGGKALPLLSGPVPGQSFDPCTALTWPRLGSGSGRPLVCLHGGVTEGGAARNRVGRVHGPSWALLRLRIQETSLGSTGPRHGSCA